MLPVTICMILKNEAETIGETIASARVAFGDALQRLVIHDTGSTDATVNQVMEASGDVPLSFDARTFDRFDRARNAVLERAELGTGHYVVMLNAGCVVRGTWNPPPEPSSAVLECEWRLGNLQYWNRVGYFSPLRLRYVGAVHELLDVPPEMAWTKAHDCGIVLDYCLKDTARPERWKRDLELLENDHSPRGRFYYAQTLELLGRNDDAYVEYVSRGCRTDGSWQERVMAWIRAIRLAPTSSRARACVSAAVDLDPTRGEAWLEMAEREYRLQDPRTLDVGVYALNALAAKPKPGSLFIDTNRERRANELIRWCADREDPRR